MRKTRMLVMALGAAAAVSACTEETVTAPTSEPQLSRNTSRHDSPGGRTIDYAVIGDVPYGAAATAQFPGLISEINEDPDVRRVVHLGDTKNGSSECTDEWFEYIDESFDTFEDPLIYTPGDNEWTDCHRDNNGNWNPLERLAKIRDTYFSRPGRTLGGGHMRVLAQRRIPENQLWMENGVVFAAIHIVGSNNNLAPWTCSLPFDEACPDGNSPETDRMARQREREWAHRDRANRQWLSGAFNLARRSRAAGVVIFSHGDMWHPGDVADGADFSGHQRFVELLAERSARFGRPVLLFAGDSHDFRVDQPLIGDTNYGAVDAPNLTQITVDRSIEDDVLWLRLTVDPRSQTVFSWEEVVIQ